MMAVEVLIARGVPENRILFLNLIASPEGIARFSKRFPKVRVVTAFIDQVGPRHYMGFERSLLISVTEQGLDEKK